MRIITIGVLAVLIAGFGAGAQAAESGFTAKIYDAESNKQKLLFTYQHSSETKGDARLITNTYKDKDGGVAAVETCELVKDGNHEKFRHYHMSQKQLGAEGDIEIKDGKVFFTYVRDGKEKKAEEKATDDAIVGPAITPFLQKHWAEIAKGEKVRARMAVADRQETLGFDYYKDREETLNGQKAFVIRMKPANFMIAAIVKPLFFFYTPDGSRLLEVHGRTQVKQNVDGKWKDLDAVTVFEYAAAAPARPEPAQPGKSK